MKECQNQLTKQEYDIMCTLYQEPFINQCILAEISGHSLGVVNRCLKSLIEHGFVNDDIMLTDKARKLFQTMKPRNAVILAAGFGMRMVPINMSTPKALLEVNGERLVDRIVSQLHEAGISDITVVVGFMKESFEYLIDEYGVELVYNDEYAVKNNISSLSLVLDKLDNSYIIPCDIWCDSNPFRKNELYSWYMVSDIVDEASEVRVNHKMELIKTFSSACGNAMIGISYITRDIAEIIRKRISAYAADPAYDDKFWEVALYMDDRMIVQARVVHASDIVEINTYEQLRDLDSDSNQLKSDAINTISEVLNCRESEIKEISVLKKGMTNRSFLFSVHGVKYIMRIPGEGTDRLVNRKQEADVFKAISGLGLCDDPVYINPDNGYKITAFLEGVRVCDAENIKELRLCMEKLRAFHNMHLSVGHAFDIFGQISFYESLWDGKPSIFKNYIRIRDNVFSLRNFIDSLDKDWSLTHIDAVCDNFLFYTSPDGKEELQLTDWEYSGMQDPHVDIAMFCIYSLYNKRQCDRLIDIYFESSCDDRTRAKIYCYIAACGLLWSNWCEYKKTLGIEFGEYCLRQYQFAEDYYRYAVDLIKKLDSGGAREQVEQ